MNTQKKTNAKTVKLGTYSAFLTLVVIAIVAVVNLMVGELPSTLTKFDLSSNSVYTVSDTTIDILKGLDEDVTMYYIVPNGAQDVNIDEMLDRYASYSSRVKIVEIDPTARPGFTTKYTESTLSANSVIVESTKRHTVVPFEEIYATEYSEEDIYNYYMTGVKPTGTKYFNGEGCLTSAIDYVTSNDLPVLYVTTGHGETAFDATAAADAKAENILVEELALLTTAIIPEDAGAVLLNVPTMDLTEEEIGVLRTYLDKGGNVILLSGYGSMDKEKMPNLTALAAEWGMQTTGGLLVEGDTNHHYPQMPLFLIPTLNTSASIAANLSSQSVTNVIPFAHGITQIEGVENKSFTSVLTTSDKVYAKPSLENATTVEKEEGDIDLGKVSVAAMAEDSTSGGKLLWFSGFLFSEPYSGNNVYSYNADLFMSSLTVLCEKTSSISILGKLMQIQALNVTEQAVWFWGALLVLVLPIGTAVCGLVIWNRRRKR